MAENGGKKGNVRIISNTSQRIIPRQESREHAKIATSLRQRALWCTRITRIQSPKEQTQKGQIQSKKQHEECYRGAQCAEKQDGGEDEPAREEEAECVVEVVGVFSRGFVGGDDAETTRCEDDGDGDPETAVGGEGCGSEGVAYGHFPVFVKKMSLGSWGEYWDIPHASKQLHQTTITKSERDNNIRLLQPSHTDIDQRQHESRKSERAETEGSRVGEFATSGRLIQTRLEFTTESWEARRLSSVHVRERVAAVIVPALSRHAITDGSVVLRRGVCAIEPVLAVELLVQGRVGSGGGIGHCDGCRGIVLLCGLARCVEEKQQRKKGLAEGGRGYIAWQGQPDNGVAPSSSCRPG